eukprot:4425554-Pyramimonas_sp.AAC.1
MDHPWVPVAPPGAALRRRATEVPGGALPSGRRDATRSEWSLCSDMPVTADPQTAVAVGDTRMI